MKTKQFCGYVKRYNNRHITEISTSKMHPFKINFNEHN